MIEYPWSKVATPEFQYRRGILAYGGGSPFCNGNNNLTPPKFPEHLASSTIEGIHCTQTSSSSKNIKQSILCNKIAYSTSSQPEYADEHMQHELITRALTIAAKYGIRVTLLPFAPRTFSPTPRDERATFSGIYSYRLQPSI